MKKQIFNIKLPPEIFLFKTFGLLVLDCDNTAIFIASIKNLKISKIYGQKKFFDKQIDQKDLIIKTLTKQNCDADEFIDDLAKKSKEKLNLKFEDASNHFNVIISAQTNVNVSERN